MADNVQVTQGSGTIISTDERSIGGATVHVQRVADVGTAAVAHGQNSTVGTTAAVIAAARETRRRIVIANQGSVDCYVGNSNVTSSTGVLLKQGAALEMQTVAAVYAITASGTATVHYWEEYD